MPDPYVSVRLQKKRLGRTSTRPNTLNPVWTNKNDKETFTLKNVPTYAKETQGTSASEYVVTLNAFLMMTPALTAHGQRDDALGGAHV